MTYGKSTIAILFVASTITGCSTGALFVTKTSIAVADIDSTPASASIAYDRTEGYIAPRNKNGDVAPVLAHIQSDGLIVSPDIQQIYATGTAAERLAGDGTSNNSTCTNCGDSTKYPVSFITSTTIGVKLGFQPNSPTPNEFIFGFKRKEASVIPELAKDSDGVHHYPSLIASIKSFATSSGKDKDGICQFFATGTAATKLVENNMITIASPVAGQCGPNDALILKGEYKSSLSKQAELTLEVINCYLGLNDIKKDAAWNNAANLGLLVNSASDNTEETLENNRTQLKDIQSKATPTPSPDNENAKAAGKLIADRLYIGHLQNNISGTVTNSQLVGNKHREINLQSHRDLVCNKQ